MINGIQSNKSLLLSKRATRFKRIGSFAGQGFLLLVTAFSAITVFFIFYFIIKDAFPFFLNEGLKEFFSSTRWYPSGTPAEFGALAIFFGSIFVTIGAAIVAVPLGISAAVCLSDILPFGMRQMVKPVIEILAAIPSVAYGFFALVVFAPYLQNSGEQFLNLALWFIGFPVLFITSMILSNLTSAKFSTAYKKQIRIMTLFIFIMIFSVVLYKIGNVFGNIKISSGTNAFNVSIILGIMALPSIVSVSEDALQAVGRELREGSYALGATRSETILKVVIPAASSGICAAVILGIMRAIGETMVVWMASGNAAKLPVPIYNFFEPVRTLTATIAGDMGEADHVTGSSRYHVLFAMAFCLLAFSFLCNLVSEWIVRRAAKKFGK